MLLLLGTDDALLEGLVQSLAGAGQRVRIASTLSEAEEVARGESPLLVVVGREFCTTEDAPRIARLAISPGGAIVLYHTTNAAAPVPTVLARLTLADLELPLERQRLLALTHHVDARARESGRVRRQTPPEHRAP